MEGTEIIDHRLDFIGRYIQKTLKLKCEKWMRLLSTAEYRIFIQDFLDNPNTLILIIFQVLVYQNFVKL